MNSSIKKKGVKKKGIKDRMSLNQRESELLICAWLSLKNPQVRHPGISVCPSLPLHLNLLV